ncbi:MULTISPECIES: D-arabinono-1,4-lactone oxidase [Dietzia]|uniref:D-arabinono-1,4-lactone oxidase n=1 Tax=Dietzia cinnamea TaxID=321318 RepID=A0A4R3ZW55_9ACTN|nr:MULTISPECIES: D-arabinono-1,4-lactone oxidase [Dietzia]KZO58775.1 FAD-linked oxidoreductase [Dietzia maris]MCT1710979.1 FAD-binding protein [Dietzia cinnamea]MCT1884198.1 FAD-binding protein [Dietzia cinnamea]MCT2057471.1 FAD-binding protein [Dietzia cinnamea]MCT2063227.1 FAD-binding protein [Dietzia cinnamea]
MTTSVSPWQNWAGNVLATPSDRRAPTTVAEVSDVVTAAAERGDRVKCVGAGHSFTPAAATDGVLVSLDDLTGIESIVPTRDAAGRVDGADVTVWAGTRLHRLGPLLWELGLAQQNLGDFAEQSLAGAVSTGTHGTGCGAPGLPATVVGLQLVAADGSVLSCSPTSHPEVFEAARLGIGALGVITKMTIRCVPAFALRAEERPWTLSAALRDLEGFARSADHAEFFWFPHTDAITVKRNTRLPGDTELSPVGRVRELVSDEFLANEAFDALCRAATRRPTLTPRLNRFASRALTARGFTDRGYRVFASPRRVRFREMEYAVPLGAASSVLRDLRDTIDRSGVVTPFPVEVRFAAADDVWMSTAHHREVCYIAVHQYHRMDHTELFRLAESIFLASGGRPHWGKMHTRTAADLSTMVERFDDFVSVRDRLDPDRLFGNEYTERVLP